MQQQVLEERDVASVQPSSDVGVNVRPCPECHRMAEVVDRFDLESTAGRLRHLRLRCAQGRHHLTLVVDSSA